MSESCLIVEDHPLTAEGVRHEIQARHAVKVYVAASLAEAESFLATASPCYLVIDMSLPDGDGVAFFQSLRASRSDVRGILLSGMLSDADVQRALTAGFSGILTKSSPPNLVGDALANILAGSDFYSPDVAPIVESLQGGDLFTPRMLEVLRLLQDGLSNKQIAAHLDVTEATVSFHVSQIKTRVGARTNRQILVQAQKLGISLAAD